MCYLEETTFRCGHTRRSILLACNFAQRLYRIKGAGGPTFCLHGFKVIKDTTVQQACGASDRHFCDRVQLKVLKPLFARQAVIEQEMEMYAVRIRNVKACLDNAERPIYNFQQIAQEGWNAKEEQRRQDDLWEHVLPNTLEKAAALFAHACNQMTTAYMLTVNEISRWHFNKPLVECDPPALETPLDPSWTIVDWLRGDNFKPCWKAAIYEEVYHKTRRMFQHELIQLETQALQACMDDVGWVLPDEENAKHTLGCVMLSRLVQPVEKSGTQVREAFIRRDSSCSFLAVPRNRAGDDLPCSITQGIEAETMTRLGRKYCGLFLDYKLVPDWDADGWLQLSAPVHSSSSSRNYLSETEISSLQPLTI